MKRRAALAWSPLLLATLLASAWPFEARAYNIYEILYGGPAEGGREPALGEESGTAA